MQTKDLLTILARLQSKHKCLAFGAGCCERLMPVFLAYCKHTDTREDFVLECKELIWSLVMETHPYPSGLSDRIEQLNSLTPDPDRSDFFLVNCAANAVTAIQACLRYFETNDLDNLAKVSQLSFSTIDEYIGRVDYPLSKVFSETAWFVAWIKTHPLLQEELERQNQDIDILASNTITEDVIHLIRKESVRCGIQPFRRGFL